MRFRVLLGICLALLERWRTRRARNPWPNKSIRWIVPYPAGGGTDLMARVLARS